MVQVSNVDTHSVHTIPNLSPIYILKKKQRVSFRFLTERCGLKAQEAQ